MAVAAGAVALPTLLKLSAILESQGQSITSMEELPVELELGKVCMLGSCSFAHSDFRVADFHREHAKRGGSCAGVRVP